MSRSQCLLSNRLEPVTSAGIYRKNHVICAEYSIRTDDQQPLLHILVLEYLVRSPSLLSEPKQSTTRDSFGFGRSSHIRSHVLYICFLWLMGYCSRSLARSTEPQCYSTLKGRPSCSKLRELHGRLSKFVVIDYSESCFLKLHIACQCSGSCLGRSSELISSSLVELFRIRVLGQEQGDPIHHQYSGLGLETLVQWSSSVEIHIVGLLRTTNYFCASSPGPAHKSFALPLGSALSSSAPTVIYLVLSSTELQFETISPRWFFH